MKRNSSIMSKYISKSDTLCFMRILNLAASSLSFINSYNPKVDTYEDSLRPKISESKTKLFNTNNKSKL